MSRSSIYRNDTSDGIDIKLALHYYSRILFIQKAIPKLSLHEDKIVLNILSAGVHSSYTKFDDIELNKNYSISNAANAAGFYTDLALDKLSRLHPQISFQHLGL